MSVRLLVVAAALSPFAALAAPLVVDGTNSPFTVSTSVNDTWDSVSVEVGGTLIVNGTVHVTAGDFVVKNGGLVKTTQGIALVTIDATGHNVDVQFGGFIDVSALGLIGGTKAGNAFGCLGQTLDPITYVVQGGSGQYQGGSGVARGGGAGSAPVYGNQLSPPLRGGGGGCGGNSVAGGNGGGALLINALTLRVDGTILSNGQGTSSWSAGAGSAGSITANVTTFVGSGAVAAFGGNGDGAGGAGGRINIALSTWSFTGNVGATGGSGNPAGALGSVYLRTPAGVQYVRGGWVDFTGTDSADRIIFGPGGDLRLSGPAVITNPIIVTGGATLTLNASTALGAATLFSSVDGTLVVNAPLARTGDLTINGFLTLNGQLTVTGDFTLGPSAVATNIAQSRNASLVVTGVYNHQGLWNLVGKGCPAASTYDTVTHLCAGGPAQYAGGSFGGRGGGSSSAAYGTQDAPGEPGSGGAYGGNSVSGGAGGGLVRIQAGTLNLDGVINADGVGTSSWSAGAGSGGAIRIDATTVNGAGVIRAMGAVGDGGGGGGGRISINYTTWAFAGSISAVGGSGNPAGADGTVRLKSAANTLMVINGRYDLGSVHSYASVFLTGNAWLTITGTPTVTAQIAIPASNKLSLNTSDALTNLSIGNTINGTLEINAPFTLGPQTVPGALIVNADTTLGNVSATGTVELNATLSVPDLTLNAPARLTHAPAVVSSVLNASGTVLVSNGAAIDLDGKGLAPNWTYNPITLAIYNYSAQYCGGPNGGVGGGNSPPAYGSATQPVQLGSGGCYGGNSVQGARGGGRIRVTATTLRVDGYLSARGLNTSSWGAGAGSGGSVWATVTNFSGLGNLYFNGGTGDGGGGGGGRISIDYVNDTHTGALTAAGGPGNPAGAQGTVRVQSSGSNPDLIVQAGDFHVSGGETYNSVTLRQGAVLYFDGPAKVVMPLVIPTGTTVWFNTSDATTNIGVPARVDGTLVLNAPLTLSVPTQIAGVLWSRQPVTFSQSLDLLTGATLRVDDRFIVNGDLTLAGAATVTHSAQVKGMDLRVSGRLLIPVGAAVQADGLGYPGGYLGSFGCSGTAHDPSTQNPRAGSAQYGGGSYGGLGGGSSNPLYGTTSSVEFPGSGGGCGGNSVAGANGGGVIRITASVVELYGHIRASGNGTGSWSAGAGSGGGIHVVAAALLGNGLVRANGGPGSGGGGGGGRILLELGNNAFTGVVEALGGSGTPVGAVGSTSTPASSGPPVITSVAATVARINTAWAYDADGLPAAAGAAPLTWSLVSGPPTASVNAGTGAFTWTPTSLGRSTFVLRVTNANGSSDQTFSVDVLAPPVVTSSAAGTGTLNAPYHYSASDLIVVSGSQPLTFNATVAPPGAPSFAVDQAGKVTWTPNSQGTFGPCVRVSNPVGSTDHCFTVNISGQITPPTITSTPPLTGAVGLPYSYQLLATGSAPITIAFLSGASPTGATVSATGGQVQWTPTAVGAPYFCVRASNGGGSDTQCWDVAVVAAPQAPQFTSSCAPLATVGQPYHYDADDTFDLSGTQPMTFTLISPPSGMSVDAVGKLSWTPSQAAAVLFSVRADNSAGSATQTCLVTARSGTPNVGAPLILRTANPVAAVGLPYFVGPGGKLTADGEAPITWTKDTGPGLFRIDGATGTVNWKPSSAGVQAVTVKAKNAQGEDSYTFNVDVKPAAPTGPRAGIKGGSSITGPAPFLVNADAGDTTSSAKILSWVWSWGDGSADSQGATASHTYTGCGGYVLRLTVTDEFGQTSTTDQLVAVTCGGLTPPTARIVMPVRTGVGSLQANFSAEIIAGSGTIHGQQWLSTDGFSSDQAADTHTFLPGGHTLQLIVVDANGLTAIDRVQVTVTDAAGNEPPRVIVWATPPSGAAPLQVTFGASAVDPDGSIAAGTWTFLDGNTSSEQSPSKVYSEATLDRAVYEVTDDRGLKASAMVDVNVVSASGDAAPEIISTPRVSVYAGALYTYDKDGLPTVRGAGPFSFALTAAPAGATVDASTGLIQWTPAASLAGNFDFTLEVTGKAGKAMQTWTVEVVGLGGTNSPPAQGCTCATVDASWAALAMLLLGLRPLRRRARR